MIGGQGTFGWKQLPSDPFSRDAYIPGGYGGGGPTRPNAVSNYPASSGGGRTSLMMLEDDIFHSVLVSGGGGGCDDYSSHKGMGGAGGGLSAQSFWITNTYQPNFESNSSHFFTYGNGEAVIKGKSAHPQGSKLIPSTTDEYSGAGGGWFGGFASFHANGGSGGGSSFALTSDAEIPTLMEVRNSFYEIESTGNYAFNISSEFIMTHVVHSPGIWLGNGMFRITLNPNNPRECTCDYYINPLFSILMKSHLYIDVFISI